MIDVAVIGCGMAAQTFHLPLITATPGLRLTAIVSRQSGLDLSPYPHARQYADLPDLLKEASADLVVITTPNTLHFSQARQALLAGKHVVLEKPMTITLPQAQELIALAATQGKHLAVFHNRRLDGDFLTLKELIASGRLGHIRTLRSHWDRFRPEVRQRWRESGGEGSGIWYDLAPHLIDQMLCLFGLPQAITARLRPLRPGSESDDYAHVQLHYTDKEILLHTSPYTCAPTPRFTVEGDKGNYRKYGLDPQEVQLKSGLSPNDPAFGAEAPEHYGTLYFPDGSSEILPTLPGRFADYYANIAAAIRGEAELAVHPEQALAVMRLLLLAIDSAAQGKTLNIS